jgi:hypothetical protein
MTNRQRKYRPDNAESKQASAPVTRMHDFFAESSIDDLAHAQELMPFKDIADLAGGIPADQDIDEFLGEIYAARR